MRGNEILNWAGSALGLVYPDVCGFCGSRRAGAREGYVCGECRVRPGHVSWLKPPYCSRCGLPYSGEMAGPFRCGNCDGEDLGFEWARASVVATPFLLEVIHRYKYGRALWFEPFLSALLVEPAVPALADGGWDGLVPVPLHRLREREREFNQAERLAECLGRNAGMPVLNGLVVKSEATRVQAMLDRREREVNVRGAFRVPARMKERVSGRRFVVVDDVMTTGATTSAVAWALKEAGAAEVVVWTLARGT